MIDILDDENILNTRQIREFFRSGEIFFSRQRGKQMIHQRIVRVTGYGHNPLLRGRVKQFDFEYRVKDYHKLN